MKRCSLLSLALVLAFFVSPNMSWADEKSANMKKTTWGDVFSGIVGSYPLTADQISNDPAQKGKLNQPKNWEFDFGMQRFIMSHTSYEVGTSEKPFYNPISRLEFPLDTWWLTFELRRTCPRWSVGTRAGLSVARNIDGRMEDSDWENPNSPAGKTTYSQSAMRAEANYLFRTDADVNISDWLGLPPSFEIRPLFAFEFQRLNLMAHDGIQWDEGGGTGAVALAGDSIHFRQDYYLYQIGLRGSYEHKINKYLAIKTHGEADWGPAVAFNEDHHLQREGNLFGYIKSSGNSLYFSTGLDIVFAKTITAGIIMDYKFIRTTGEERYYNAPRGENIKWTNGVKVWSDQTSLIARISYAF